MMLHTMEVNMTTGDEIDDNMTVFMMASMSDMQRQATSR